MATPPSLQARNRCLFNTVTAKDTNNRLPIVSLKHQLRPPSITRTSQLIRAVPTLLASIQTANQSHLSSQIQSTTPLTLRFYPRISIARKTPFYRFLSLRAFLHLPLMKRRLRCPITLGMKKILTQGCSRHVDFSLNLHRISKSVRRLPITNFIISTLPTLDTLAISILSCGGHHSVDFRP